MSPRPFLLKLTQWVRTKVRTHPRATRWLAGGLVAWVALCFALGYRLPWFDRHPSWSEFPHLTNPRLVVEEIPDSVFGPRYSHRFPYPEEADTTRRNIEPYSDYATNLRSIRSVGYQPTSNKLHLNLDFLHWSGPADLGVYSPRRPNGFRSFGYEYLTLTLANETGNFKADNTAEAATERMIFYQYNNPTNRQDTLYLRYMGTNYRVFIR